MGDPCQNCDGHVNKGNSLENKGCQRHFGTDPLPADKESDYPNAEELRHVADRFILSYPDLQIRFGLMSRQEVWSYLESAPVTGPTATTTTKRRRPKLSELTPRQDALPL